MSQIKLNKLEQHIRDNKGLEPQEMRAELESVDEENRTATFSFSSEFEGQRWWGVEILDHAPSSVRMDRINNGGAFLMDHDRWDQRGVVEKAWLENSRGFCTVRLSQNPKGEELWVDIKDKIRTQVSVRYAIHEAVLEKKVGDMEYYRVTDWEPMEISSVSIAFDPTVGVGRSQEKQTYLPVNLKGAPAMDPTELENDLNQGQRSDNQPPLAAPVPVAAARAAAPVAAPVLEAAPVNHSREIAQIGEQYGATELAMRSIAEGDTVDAFKTKLLDAHQERAAAPDSQTTMLDIGLTDKQRSDYSVMNVIRALSTGNHEKYAPFELEVSRAIAEKKDTEVRGILVPYDVLGMGMGMRQQEVGTASLGGNLVANELHAEHFIEALRQVSMMGQLGVRTLTGLVGNMDMPKQTGTSTFYWVGEDGEPTDSDLDFGLVQMSPRTVAGAVPITRRLMVQTSGQIEGMVRNDLLIGLAEALDNDVLATILATAGIGAQAFATAGKPTWAEVVGLETDVDEANALRGSPAYLMRPSMKGNLKTTIKTEGSAEMIWAANVVNGMRAASSTQMTAAKILFGDFSQAMIGLWGAVDLTVDKSTKAASGGSVLRIFQDADTAVRHAGAFSLGQ